MGNIFLVLISTIIVSLISLIGILVISLRDELLKKIVDFLVFLSVGVLLGVAFLDLIPEALEEFDNDNIFLFVLVGFFLFFAIERILQWRHCHKAECPVHSFGYVNLFGDAVHNLTDGLIIGASFAVSIPLGVASVIAVIFHEIPHEIGEFGVLLYAGFTKTKALFFNFLSALTAILGGVIGFYLSSYTDNFTLFLLPFAAGGFIYIAASDLIPEIQKDHKKPLISFSIPVLGVLLVYLAKMLAN